jgi:hypothetical protein
MLLRMNEIVEIIRAEGSANLVLHGEVFTIGFEYTDNPNWLTMRGGGYYTVHVNGYEGTRKIPIAKGQLCRVV